VALLAFAAVAMAANKMEGTWKLDPSKSTTTGMPKMKEATVTFTPEGSGWKYQTTGTRENGDSVTTSFVYVKDGDDITLANSALGDTLVLQHGNADVSTGVFKRAGKTVGKVKRTMSADGKTMTVTGNSVTPDGKKVTYTSVYMKE
jgi:hypothetical protein